MAVEDPRAYVLSVASCDVCLHLWVEEAEGMNYSASAQRGAVIDPEERSRQRAARSRKLRVFRLAATFLSVNELPSTSVAWEGQSVLQDTACAAAEFVLQARDGTSLLAKS